MSESQVAATDSALRMQAGAWICCTLPWLPVDTVTTAPLATSASTATARLCVHAVRASQWPGTVSSLPRLRLTNRKSLVQGKRGDVRVDHGGRRKLKKNNN